MKKLGYLQLVNNNEFALKSLKVLMVLPLLLARRIEEGFIDIKQYAIIHHVNLRRLFNYYERYYIYQYYWIVNSVSSFIDIKVIFLDFGCAK